MTKPNPLFHSERPWEILRDTIIINRPFNDSDEFQIIAWVSAGETWLEAAKDNAKFIKEACNNYLDDNHPGKYLDPSIGSPPPMPGTISRHEADTILKNLGIDRKKEAVNLFKELTHIGDLATEELGVADADAPTITVDKHHYEQMDKLIKQLDIILRADLSYDSIINCLEIRMYRYKNGKDL